MAIDEARQDDAERLFIGLAGEAPQFLTLSRANRHGLIAGATGTGKTVTLQGLAESFSAAGVPVFVADVKGDLAGIAMAGSPTDKAHSALTARAAEIGLANYAYSDNPAIFWDLFGEQGHPIRTTVSEMGPLLLARLLSLNETQEGVLNIAFRVADEQGLLLLNLDDLHAMLVHCAENAADLTARYGNVARPTVGAIQRQILQLDRRAGPNSSASPRSTSRISSSSTIGPGLCQHPRRRPADDQPAPLCDLPLVAAFRIVRGIARGRRSAESPNWSSSSTRRICCSKTCRRCCPKRSNRSSG